MLLQTWIFGETTTKIKDEQCFKQSPSAKTHRLLPKTQRAVFTSQMWWDSSDASQVSRLTKALVQNNALKEIQTFPCYIRTFKVIFLTGVIFWQMTNSALLLCSTEEYYAILANAENCQISFYFCSSWTSSVWKVHILYLGQFEIEQQFCLLLVYNLLLRPPICVSISPFFAVVKQSLDIWTFFYFLSTLAYV